MTICLISSSGGHYEQLMRLKKLEENHKVIVATEKTSINNKSDYYFPQINRKEISVIIKLLIICFKSIKILIIEKPDIIISTGALCSIPMCVLGKLFRKKIIFIESFAKIKSPTITGKFVYKFADMFIIQWEELLKFYPNAIYGGSIY